MGSTVLGGAAPTRAGLAPKNGVLGSAFKACGGFKLKTTPKVGRASVCVRASVASSPQKQYSPKTPAVKSGEEVRIAVLGASGYTGAEEGWHYELNNPEEEISYKGVVFNEMKGVYSQPDNIMGRVSQQALSLDNTYGVDSGGDPNEIPKLTFEEFKVSSVQIFYFLEMMLNLSFALTCKHFQDHVPSFAHWTSGIIDDST